MYPLSFRLPDGSVVDVSVRAVLNAGYAGADQEQVRAHVSELAELGVPAPSTTPVYAVSPYLAQQTDRVDVQHNQTSGEAEWALVIAGDTPADVLITAACDHTDRALEVHGVGWSKNASPDVLGREAWRLIDIADHLDAIEIIGRVGSERRVIQSATFDALLSPQYWLDVLQAQGRAASGTVLLSGTVAMTPDLDPFSDRWEVQLVDHRLSRTVSCDYAVAVMPSLEAKP